uniref:Uncharacterized protein n=1 Tax=Cuerna arida TaxID=1464854 RepID=A0A1B6FBI7_9HEMI
MDMLWSTVICNYVFVLSVLALYLGRLVVITLVEDQPPSFAIPRLLFMLAVAILVERRAGYTSCLYRPVSLLYEVIITILMCNLALTLVWDQLEKIVHLILSHAAMAVETVLGCTIVCPKCKGVHGLQFAVTLVIAILVLCWVLYSVTTYALFEKTVRTCMYMQPLQLRFCSVVQVRYINPETHTTECPILEQLNAPRDDGKNPVIDPQQFEIIGCCE